MRNVGNSIPDCRFRSKEVFFGALTVIPVTHRPQFSLTQTRVGCIDRLEQRIIVQRSGEIHRLQFGAVKSVVKLMALGNAWRPANACVPDQGLTVRGQ